MTNRIVYTDSMATFKRLLMDRYHDLERDLEDKELAAQIEELQVGCFIIIFRGLPAPYSHHAEPLTMHRFVKNVSTMISKENLFSMHMRYLDTDERAQARQALYQEVPASK
jgi:hypothetical protein